MGSSLSFRFTDNKGYKWGLSTGTALFAFMFLLFFQPFGINNYRPDEKITSLLVTILFLLSLIVFLIIGFLEFFVRRLINQRNRPVQFLLWVLLEILLVSSSTFLFYNYVGDFHDFYLLSYLKHILEMGSVLLFPFLATIFYFKYRTVAKDLSEVLSVSGDSPDPDEIVLLAGDYKKDKIAVALKNIVYLESEDNYVGLNYFEGGQLKKYLIRSTLTQLEKRLHTDLIVRCNRSILINLLHLQSSRIRDSRLLITLSGTNQTFLASKSRQAILLRSIEDQSRNRLAT